MDDCASPRLTDKQVERLRAKWERRRHGHPRLLTPLPRHVRLRLAAQGAINHAGYWLVCHDQSDAAVRLWKLCGMWD